MWFFEMLKEIKVSFNVSKATVLTHDIFLCVATSDDERFPLLSCDGSNEWEAISKLCDMIDTLEKIIKNKDKAFLTVEDLDDLEILFEKSLPGEIINFKGHELIYDYLKYIIEFLKKLKQDKN
jgi:hypothetical protein